jgi:hypothetical protein
LKETYSNLEDYRYLSGVEGVKAKDLSTYRLGRALICTSQ